MNKGATILLIFVVLLLLAFSLTKEEEKPYGELWNYTDGGFTFNATQSDVYYNVTGFICGNNKLIYCVKTPSLNYLQITKTGFYKANAFISGKGSTAGGIYGVSIAKNFNEKLSRNCYIQVEGITSQQVININCILYLKEGDTISLKVDDEASPTKTFNIYSMNLNAVKI